MTTGLPALRGLIIYGLCLPLALLIGYMLAQPLDWQTLGFFGVLLLVICTPLLLRWHHAILIASVNATAVAMLPGHPALWIVLATLSLAISVLQLTLSRRFRFLYSPTTTRPLLVLLAVILVTAKLNGGIGFHMFGGQNIGGRKYLDVFGAIIAYFALTARRIPAAKASLYTGLFFLAGTTAMIGSLAHFVPPGLYFIFMFFPPEAVPGESVATTSAWGLTRLGGAAFGCLAVISWLLCRYGLRGTLASGKPWRALLLGTCVVLSLFGGFRVVVITILLFFFVQAYLEGLFRSRWMPVLALGGAMVAVSAVPFVSKLPFSLQRSLAVLPVEVDPAVRTSAKDSSDWRVQIWREVLPQVPHHLLLGKGYSISAEEWAAANFSSGSGQAAAIVSGDYHNGPLSVVMPFGIWGVLAFGWLVWAGGRLLYSNYKYGDPAHKDANRFLLVVFIVQTLLFVALYGSFAPDLIKFTSLFGLSVSLNGGMCRRVPAPAERPVNIRIRAPLKPAAGFSR
jgi:hypothetical protein